jgi:hypothetical protein
MTLARCRSAPAVWTVVPVFLFQCLFPAPLAAQVAPDLAEAEQAVRRHIDRLFQAVEVLQAVQDPTVFEIGALSERLGSDPTQLFQFVRDEIDYQPYYGALRGGLGTLLAGVGNSLDQSLLLAALLQRQGHRPRIVRGVLPEGKAAALVAQLRARPGPQAAARPDAVVERLLADSLQLPYAEFRVHWDEYLDRSETADEAVWDRAERHRRLIAGRLSEAGLALPEVSTPAGRLLNAAADHFWVQVTLPDGRWLDLDASWPEARPGEPLTAALDAYSPEALPEDLFHQLRITLTLRTGPADDANTVGEGLTDTPLIDATLRVAELSGVPVSIANVPDLTDEAILGGTAGLQEVMAGIGEFTPVLAVGGEPRLTGKTFDLDGRLFTSSRFSDAGQAERHQRTVGEGLEGIRGALGGLFRDPDAGDPPAASEAVVPRRRIVGEWVEYRLIAPQGKERRPEERSFRRDIVAPERVTGWSPDGEAAVVPARHGKAALRAALTWSAELAPIVGPVPTTFATAQQLAALSDSRRLLDTVLGAAFGRKPAPEDLAVAQPSPRPTHTTAFLATAHYWESLLAHSRFPDLRYFYAAPGLVAFEQQLDARSGAVVVREGYDIVANDVRIVALTANTVGGEGMAQDAADFALQRGILATIVEAALMEPPDALLAGADQVRATPIGTATVIDTAIAAGLDLVVLQPGPAGRDRLARLALPSGLKREIAAQLERAAVIIVPSGMVSLRPAVADLGWWRIDAKTASALGIMAGGRGQATAEKGVSEADRAKTLGIIIRYATMAGCLSTFVRGGDAGQSSTVDVTRLAACIASGYLAQIGITAQLQGNFIAGLVGVLLGIAAGEVIRAASTPDSPASPLPPATADRGGTPDAAPAATAQATEAEAIEPPVDPRDQATTSEDAVGGGSGTTEGPRFGPVVLPDSERPARLGPGNIRELKEILLDRRFYDGGLDDQEDPGLAEAIARYQQSIGVEPTGVLTVEQAGRLLGM